jgi:glycosyltransferase involved in cell wall biosynthesis
MVVFTDIRYDYRVYREATSLARAGHKVTVVSSAFAPSPLDKWAGVEIQLLPVDRTRSLRLSYPAFWRAAYPAAVAVRADAYHAHDLDALLPAARAARRHGVPLVYDSHELFIEQPAVVGRPWVRTFWALLEHRLIRRARRVVTVCDSIARYLERRYRLERVEVVRNTPEYRLPVASQRLRTALEVPPDQALVLYQGGFLTDSGLAEQIESSAGFGAAVLVLLGSGPSEPHLRRLVRSRGLDQRVRFLPRVPFDQLHAYTCSADLGLCLFKGRGLSSYYSLPNKLFEYLMAGLPVVGSDSPEIARVVLEGSCGLVVPPTDREAIARGVRQLLEEPGRRQACRQAALRLATQYNWEAEAPRLLGLYEAL